MITKAGLKNVIIQALQGTTHEDDPQSKFAEAVAKYFRDNLTISGIYMGNLPVLGTPPDPLSGSYTINPLLMTMDASKLKNAAKSGSNAWYLEIMSQIYDFTFNPAVGAITIAGLIKPINGVPIVPVIKYKTDFNEIMDIVASCIIRDATTLPPNPPSFSVISTSGGTGTFTVTGYA